MSEWLTKQSFQIDEATAERDALVLPSKSRGAEIRLSSVGVQIQIKVGLLCPRLAVGAALARCAPIARVLRAPLACTSVVHRAGRVPPRWRAHL
jgi:hypothetical protein